MLALERSDPFATVLGARRGAARGLSRADELAAELLWTPSGMSHPAALSGQALEADELTAKLYDEILGGQPGRALALLNAGAPGRVRGEDDLLEFSYGHAHIALGVLVRSARQASMDRCAEVVDAFASRLLGPESSSTETLRELNGHVAGQTMASALRALRHGELRFEALQEKAGGCWQERCAGLLGVRARESGERVLAAVGLSTLERPDEDVWLTAAGSWLERYLDDETPGRAEGALRAVLTRAR